MASSLIRIPAIVPGLAPGLKTTLALLLLLDSLGAAPQDSEALRKQSLEVLKKASVYYRTQIARHSGYVYYTSADLKERWGEGKAGPDVIFVQPPGTPTVGLAYLKAHAATR